MHTEAIMTTGYTLTTKSNPGKRSAKKGRQTNTSAVQTAIPLTLRNHIQKAKRYVEQQINRANAPEEETDARVDKHNQMLKQIAEQEVETKADAWLKLQFLKDSLLEDFPDPSDMYFFDRLHFSALDSVLSFLEGSASISTIVTDPHIEWWEQIQELNAEIAKIEEKAEAIRKSLPDRLTNPAGFKEAAEKSGLRAVNDESDCLGEMAYVLGIKIIETPAATMAGVKIQAEYTFSSLGISETHDPETATPESYRLHTLVRTLRQMKA